MALLNADVERDCRIQHAKPLIAEQQLLELIPAVMLRARREVPKVAEALALVAAGQSEAEIAASLGVTVPTAIKISERAQRWLRGQLEKED
jgi:predicted transcriptional regulator